MWLLVRQRQLREGERGELRILMHQGGGLQFGCRRDPGIRQRELTKGAGEFVRGSARQLRQHEVGRERRGVARQLTAGGAALVLAGVLAVLLLATLVLGGSRWLALPRITPFAGWALALAAGVAGGRWLRRRLSEETSVVRIAHAVEEERRQLTTGQSAVIPAGRKHGFHNTGTGILRVQAILASPVFEAAYDDARETPRRWLPTQD
mgnify:CR=1 FL=1